MIVTFNALYMAFLLLKPGSHALVTAVTDVANTVGPLLAAVLWTGRPGRRERMLRRDMLAPLLLGLGILGFVIGQGIWTVYEVILRQPSPFPSWADAGYLSAYPFLFLGILLLPTRPLPAASRVRVVLDSLMIMAALVTCSWYFILGPTLLQGGETLLAKVVGTAYPVGDLVLMLCLLLLAARAPDAGQRPAIGLLGLGLASIVVVDSIFDVQTLHGSYVSGELIAPLWAIGYMTVGLGARAARLAQQRQRQRTDAGEEASASYTLPLWRALLPYALIPAVGVLLVVVATRHTRSTPDVAPGVYIGSGVLLGLVLLRQIIALYENSRLYCDLHDTYRQLEERNRQTTDYAQSLERLNADLRAMHTDNQALATLNAQLETMATTDPLTGLPNRSLLHDRLEQALRAARRDQTPLALLLMDLDRFKEVNDTLGHHCGDLLLQQVGRRLHGALRASDTVARLGGDEFAILLPGADAAGAVQATHNVRVALETPFVIEEQALDIGTSIGIALSPLHGADAATLVRQADVAMYEAKRTQSGYAVYDPAQDQHSAHRLALIGDLRLALTQEHLLLYYQPLVDLERGAVSGVEALLRWPHPQHGFLPPDQFIPLAEHTGLIVPLTQWVLERALAQCQTWQRSGLLLGMQVNLSARTLHDEQLPDTVAALLQRYQLAPEWLTLEITESALMADPARALEVLTRLAALGVRLAIDDFGAGYSSLSYLKRLPVHDVKIDKSFVLGMREDGRDAAIVRSVVAMAHALGLEVVAEGVENTLAWDLLCAWGCDVAQGYYLSKPLPPAEAERWIRDAFVTMTKASA